MKKMVRWTLLMLLPVFMLSCAKLYDGDDPTVELPILPPGKVYTPEGPYNLNVVYYVPSDVDSVAMWHYRLSGITLHAQDYYKQNMKRYMYDKTFRLITNNNPDYIKIHYIKSKRGNSAMQAKDMAAMTEEIMAYFKENPSEQTSNHFLVYMPKFKESAMNHTFAKSSESTLTVPDLSFAFLGCDEARFNIKYYSSEKARKRYLVSLGEVLYQLGRSFLLTCNTDKEGSPTFSLMGTSLDKSYAGSRYITSNFHVKYMDTPDKIRLTATDAARLDQIQVFNEKHTYLDTRITMKEVDLRYLEDTLFVDIAFQSPDDIVSAIIYNDPWRSWLNQQAHSPKFDEDPLVESGGDALTYLTKDLKKEGDIYRASFVLPWEEMNKSALYNYENVMTAEIRFSFIGKGGIPYPHPGVGGKGTFDEMLRGRYVISVKSGGLTSTAGNVYTPDFTNFKIGE